MDAKWIIFIFMLGVVLVLFMWALGKIAPFIFAAASFRKTRIDEVPQDQAERYYSNHRWVGYDVRPQDLRSMWYSGDHDVPPKRMGRITSIEPHQEGYMVYVRSRVLSWSKPYYIPRRLCSDINMRTLVVDCRGFSIAGRYRFPIPRGESPTAMVEDGHDLHKGLFRLQIRDDMEEDTAWAMERGIAEPIAKRIAKAEAQAPSTSSSTYVSEEAIAGGKS